MTSYLSIRDYYNQCASRKNWWEQIDHGNVESVIKMYDVMLDLPIKKPGKSSLLDFGCGNGGLLKYLIENDLSFLFDYYGIDISDKLVEIAQTNLGKEKFEYRDILANPITTKFDYVIANGVFVWKGSVSQEDFLKFTYDCLKNLWEHTNIGLAFNLMDGCKIINQDRNSDYFFLTYDESVSNLFHPLGIQHWRWRADYGNNDFTVFIYK